MNIKKYFSSLCAATVLLSGASSGHAAIDQCMKYSEPYDRGYCTVKIFLSTDQEMGRTYNELKKYITKEEFAELKKLQSTWLRYRSARCLIPDTDDIDVTCSYNLTIERTDFLIQHLEHCEKGACHTRVLLEKSW